MKLMCRCGNIEDLKTDKSIESFVFRNSGDGTAALVCMKCSEVVFVKVKNIKEL